MRTTRTTPSIARSGRAPLRPAVILLALAVALTGCAAGGPATDPDASLQESTVQSTPEPTSATPEASSDATTASPSPSSSASPSSGAASPSPGFQALLTVSIAQHAAAEPVQYMLECVDGAPGPASTLPTAEAACATLARLGAEFFTARPNKDVICTQQYGGPQTASITGDVNGTPVIASFGLTDGCEISRWNQVADILGAPGAQ